MSEKNTTATAQVRMPDNQPAETQNGNTARAVIYLTAGIAGLLGPRKNDPATRFDCFQALFSAALILSVHAVLGLLGGHLLMLQELVDGGGVMFTAFQIYRAYENHPVDVPSISSLARKQAEPGNGAGSTVQ
jgi:uncharacterized membrane protein